MEPVSGQSGAARRPEPKWDLVVSFALVCGVTAGLTQAGWFARFSLDSTLAAWLGAAAGALAGAVLAHERSTPRSWAQLLLVVVSIALVAWILVSSITALDPFYDETQVPRAFPAVLGVSTPLVAFVGLLFVLAGHRAALRPRRASFLIHWARRRPWTLAAAACGAAATTAGRLQPGIRGCAVIVIGTAIVAVLVAWRLDRRDVRRLRLAAERIERQLAESDPLEWDLGEGDERWLCRAVPVSSPRAATAHEPGGPYRTADRSDTVIRGNVLAAVRRLERAATVDACIALCLVAALVCLWPVRQVPKPDGLPPIATFRPATGESVGIAGRVLTP